ncbi:MAG: AAA-like domain-containing protein [Acidobacteriota bacterium]
MDYFKESFYITGGTLRHDAACYIERQADVTIYDTLMKGVFCYVLTSRQMGKSSLMVRAAMRLRQAGVAVAMLDLTTIGQNLSVEQWYYGLITCLGEQLGLEDELEAVWQKFSNAGPLQRYLLVVRELVRSLYTGKVVIFIDEIDIVCSLPFSTDEFFAGIRELYNHRTTEPELYRLSICLLGVVVPYDLIQDTRLTPFNIGQRIELLDFTAQEAATLAKGLQCDPPLALALLQHILTWTYGHPYLTQHLCQAVAERALKSASEIDKLCEELFLSNHARVKDTNLLFVRERILHCKADVAALLDLYKKILDGKLIREDETNPLVDLLRLSGIVRVEDGYFKVRNRIYAHVFNREWIEKSIPDAESRRQRAAYWKGLLRAASVATLIIATMAYLIVDARKQRSFAEQEKNQSRRLLYVAQINLSQQALESLNIGRAKELLDAQNPRSDQQDFRGFEWYYLWKSCHLARISLNLEQGIESLAMSPDGKILVTGDIGSQIKFWDIASGELLATLVSNSDRINAVVFSPDGKLLATGDSRGIIKFWEVASRREIASIVGHKGRIKSMAFLPNGKTLVTSSWDRTIKLWDIASSKELAILQGHTDSVEALAILHNGQQIVTAGSDHTVRIWQLASRKELVRLGEYTSPVLSLAVSPDGQRLATGSYDGSVKVWDLTTRQLLFTLKDHSAEVNVIAFSPDGRILATAGSDSSIRLFDLTARQHLVTFSGHSNMVRGMAFTPDGKILITGSRDNTVKFWDILSRQPYTQQAHLDEIWSVTFSADGKTLATASWDKTIKLWDVKSKDLIRTLIGHTDRVYAVAFSPDNRIIASGSKDSTVKLWDVTTGDLLTTLTGHKGEVLSLHFSPDGKWLVSAGEDNFARLWNTETWQLMTTLRGHQARIWSCDFSPDGKTLATASEDRQVLIWDLATQQSSLILTGHSNMVIAVAFSPDGRMLATGSYDGIVKLWDTTTGKEIVTLKGHTNRVYSVVFSPDGRRLVTSSFDATIKLWDVITWQELITLKGHTGRVLCAIFSPDGKILATSSADKTVKLWQTASPHEVIKGVF